MTEPVLLLAPVLDTAAARDLRKSLMTLRGADIALDASQVERLGGVAFEILLAARRQWHLDEMKFSIVRASEAFMAAIRLMGAVDLAAEGAS